VIRQIFKFFILVLIGISPGSLFSQKKVILIGADGLGAYAFEKAKVPNLRKLMREGSYSLKARCVLPSSSAVNWASIITASPPEMHGFTTWGSKVPEIKPVIKGKEEIFPSLFSLIKEQMPKEKMGAIYTWGGISHLVEQSLLDFDSNPETDSSTIQKALKFILSEEPLFAFIHLDEPDHTGHVVGHDTPEYYAALEAIDSLIGVFISELKQNGVLKDYVILFTSDHGGVGKGHGGKSLREMEIPWIIWGRKIKRNHELNQSIITYDTGATIAEILRLKPSEAWRGRVIRDAFK
jgi:predicted AlkP superfamily pyrophosphatase or phosphodiesterase